MSQQQASAGRLSGSLITATIEFVQIAVEEILRKKQFYNERLFLQQPDINGAQLEVSVGI